MIVPQESEISMAGWGICPCGGQRYVVGVDGRFSARGKVSCLGCGWDTGHHIGMPSPQDQALVAACLRAAGYTGVICVTEEDDDDRPH